MSESQTLFETRYPYASEAKLIVAGRLSKEHSPEISKWFVRHWEVRLKSDGSYSIIRDTFINPGSLKIIGYLMQ